jgi:hypothetical protein
LQKEEQKAQMFHQLVSSEVLAHALTSSAWPQRFNSNMPAGWNTRTSTTLEEVTCNMHTHAAVLPQASESPTRQVQCLLFKIY